MVLRQPAYHDSAVTRTEGGDDGLNVATECLPGDHHAFGLRGTARRVLEEAKLLSGEMESGLVYPIKWESNWNQIENQIENQIT